MRIPTLLVCLTLTACAPRAPDPWGEAALARLPLRERAAQLLVIPLPDSGAARPIDVRVGGIAVHGGRFAQVERRIAAWQQRAARPLLVMAQLDGGVGGVVAGGTEFPPATWLRDAGDADAAAEVVAREARALGLNLARLRGPGVSPVVPRDGSPTEAFAAGLAERGLPAVLLAMGERDTAATQVAWDRAALEAGPLGALRRAVRSRAAGVELGWSVLPALTGDTLPLPLSPVASAGLVRRDLGLAGVIAADVGAETVWRLRYGASAPVVALAAGADLLLGVSEPAAAVDSIAAAVDDGRLPRARVDDAVRRVFALKSALGLRAPQGGVAAAPVVAPGEARETAARLHTAAARRGGSPAGVLRGCGSLALVARDTSAVPALIAAVRGHFPRTRTIQADSVPLRGPLPGPGEAVCLVTVSAGEDEPRVVADTAAADSARPPRRVVRLGLGGDALPAEATPWLAMAGSGPMAQRLAAEGLVRELGTADPRWPPSRRLLAAPAESAGMRPDSLDRIDRVMAAALDSGVFTGAAIAIARRGRLVKLSGYGRTGGRPVRADSTLFDLASLTKVLGTTSAAMAMVEDERMSLDAPVRRYLAGYRGGGRGDVTLRHLLTHTAGLPAGENLYALTRSPSGASRRVRRAELRTDPGEAYLYSDFGMILLGEAIAAQAEEPLDRYLARRVFGPLGLQATHFLPRIGEQARTVPSALRSERPYVLDGVVHDGNAFRLGGVAGHAGLFSTAAEVAVLAQTVMNGGAYGDRRVWSAGTVRRFATPQRLPGGRALGWDVPGPRSAAGDYFSASSIGHTGYTGTSLWIDPQRELFVVLLTNRTYDRGSATDIYRLRRRVHDLAVRAIADLRISPREGTAAAREAERVRRRPAPRRPRRPTRRG